MKELINFVFAVIAPFLLIAAGALIAGAGIQFQVAFLFWGGLILAGVGVLWWMLRLGADS